jgi:hypothetical protein
MFNSRDFLRVEYNVLSKNVTRELELRFCQAVAF